jgi:hypothetical protein
MQGNDRGSAIIAVIGIMAVASTIALTTTSMSMHAVGYTTSTRAGVQAEAAAEAGIDFAAANLATSVCQSQYSRTTTPIFSVTIAYSTLAAPPGTTDTSWVSGCPTTGSAQRLKLVSTGTATTPGLAGNSSQNVRRVEAIFAYTPSPSSNGVMASGPAIYSYAQTDPTINNLTITQASTTRPSLQYLSGSATCTSGSTIAGDVVLGAGALSITSGCVINGDLWASGTVNIQSGEVTGNVNAAGVQGGTSVSLSNSAVVDGNIFAAGPVSINGKVGGNIVAGPTVGTSTFSNKSSVGGSVVSAGTVSASAGAIKGTITMNKSGIVTPTIPTVPPWVDYAYSPSACKTTTGAAFSLITLAACDSTTLANAIMTTQNSATSIILDTRVCGSITNLTGYNFALKSDTVIVGNGFKMGNNAIQSSGSNNSTRIWFIIPDIVADRAPTCPAGSSFTINPHVDIGSGVAAMIYSPCPITNSDVEWRGQMYASSVGSNAEFDLSFLPIGLPTVNLSTGQYLPPPGTGVLGDRTSIRDLVVG